MSDPNTEALLLRIAEALERLAPADQHCVHLGLELRLGRLPHGRFHLDHVLCDLDHLLPVLLACRDRTLLSL